MTHDTIEKVLKIVEDELGEKVELKSEFIALGVDSLDFLMIIKRVREEVGPVREELIGNINLVEDLAAAVGA